MSEPRFTRHLHLTPREYRDLLIRLDAKFGRANECNGRHHQRLDYHVIDIPLYVEQPEGGESRFLVYGRNLGPGGMSILHSGFLHIGSQCRVVLRRLDQSPLVVAGEVGHCRLAIPPCHEIGIQFHEAIDPRTVVRSAGALILTATEPSPPSPLPELHGCALVAEPFAPDRRLLEHQLTTMGLTVRSAGTPGATLDALRREDLDLILVGIPLDHEDGAHLVRRLRELGCRLPVIALARRLTADAMHAAEAGRVSDVLLKPVTHEALRVVLHAWLGPRRPRAITAEIPGDPAAIAELLARYADWTRHAAERLARALDAAEWPQVHTTALELRGSGAAYGFAHLTSAAIAALAHLNDDPDSPLTRAAVNALIEQCRLTEWTSPTPAAA